MEQQKFEIWMMEYLTGELDESGRKEFEKYLLNHLDHKKEFDAISGTWDQIDTAKVPEPSQKMDDTFFEMLNTTVEEKGRSGLGWYEKVQSFFGTISRPQLAFGTFLLGIGLSVGYFLNSNPSQAQNPVKETVVSIPNAEAEEVREQLVLTLLEQPSANKRLQGVNEANKIQKVDEKVIKALLQTLNNDPNVNVRLAAIEALTNYVDNPIVREGLVLAIVKQDSPIIQVTLANLMVALQEKKSIEPFKTLMRNAELDSSVKQKLESSIQEII